MKLTFNLCQTILTCSILRFAERSEDDGALSQSTLAPEMMSIYSPALKQQIFSLTIIAALYFLKDLQKYLFLGHIC